MIFSYNPDSSGTWFPIPNEVISVNFRVVSMPQGQGCFTLIKEVIANGIFAGLNRNRFDLPIAMVKDILFHYGKGIVK
ncbi:hypothetical protein D3C85_1379430 [compost metagenome]